MLACVRCGAVQGLQLVARSGSRRATAGRALAGQAVGCRRSGGRRPAARRGAVRPECQQRVRLPCSLHSIAGLQQWLQLRGAQAHFRSLAPPMRAVLAVVISRLNQPSRESAGRARCGSGTQAVTVVQPSSCRPSRRRPGHAHALVPVRGGRRWPRFRPVVLRVFSSRERSNRQSRRSCRHPRPPAPGARNTRWPRASRPGAFDRRHGFQLLVGHQTAVGFQGGGGCEPGQWPWHREVAGRTWILDMGKTRTKFGSNVFSPQMVFVSKHIVAPFFVRKRLHLGAAGVRQPANSASPGAQQPMPVKTRPWGG